MDTEEKIGALGKEDETIGEEGPFVLNYKNFIKERVTELRLALPNKVSEYQMSYDLGKSSNYIQSISKGAVLPKMTMFLRICEYCHVTPAEFFDENFHNPDTTREIMHCFGSLPSEQAKMILELVKSLVAKNEEGK